MICFVLHVVENDVNRACQLIEELGAGEVGGTHVICFVLHVVENDVRL